MIIIRVQNFCSIFLIMDLDNLKKTSKQKNSADSNISHISEDVLSNISCNELIENEYKSLTEHI